MSDQNPFGGSAGTAVAEPAREEVPEASGRPKPVVLAVAGAVLLVLAVAAYFLVFSGGGEGSSDAGAVVPGRIVASGSPSGVGPSPTPSVAPVVVSVNKSAWLDPFRAPPQASPSASASAVPTTAAAVPAAGGGVPAGVSSTMFVSSVSYATKSANVVVDGKSYVAHQGETFAKYYVLRSVITGQPACGVFQFGDLPAQLCKGQKATFTS